jgi:uncharacterized protein (DUF302 family)
MTLSIDSNQIDPANIGEEQATLEMNHKDAIEHVRDVFTDAGFGVPVEFSPSAMPNEKVDAGATPTTCSVRAIPRWLTVRSMRRKTNSVSS